MLKKHFFEAMSIIAVATAFMLPSLSSAQAVSSTTITTGDVCDVKNPAARNIRRQDGGFFNVDNSSTMYVYCALPQEGHAGSYGVAYILSNYSSSTQTYSCSLEEWGLDGAKVRGYSRKSTIAAGFYKGEDFANIRKSNPFNTLHLWCQLRPSSSISTILIDNFVN